MTSDEYDRSRLEALPIAIQILETTRRKHLTNPPAWDLLLRAGDRLGAQLKAEFKAYFTPDPEPPAPFAPKSAIMKRIAEAQGIPVVDVPVVEPDPPAGIPLPLGWKLIDFVTKSPATKHRS